MIRLWIHVLLLSRGVTFYRQAPRCFLMHELLLCFVLIKYDTLGSQVYLRILRFAAKCIILGLMKEGLERRVLSGVKGSLRVASPASCKWPLGADASVLVL